MWVQVKQALLDSTTRFLTRFATFLPGFVALIVALLVSFLVAWILDFCVRAEHFRLHS